MAKELLWSENNEYVYGWAKDFKDSQEFINVAKYEYEDGECNVLDVKVEHCISTEKGIEADKIIPLRLTDFEVELFYTARVEPVNKS